MLSNKNKKYIRNCTGENCQQENKQKAKFASRLIFYVLLFAFVCTTIYVLIFSPYLQITSVNIQGNQELSSSELTETIEQSLQGSWLGVIPKNNFIFFSAGRIENLLKDNYKKIRLAEVAKKFPDTLEVNIDERKALLVWCATADSCYLIDENGTAYSQADFSSQELVQNHLIRVDDQSNENIAVGEKVMEEDYEKYVLAIKDGLGNSGVEISDEYTTPSRMAQEITVKTTQGYALYFSTQFDLDEALKTLALVFKKELPSDQQANLAYVDLRIENEAFYKLNNAQPQVENQDSNQQSSQDGNKENKK